MPSRKRSLSQKSTFSATGEDKKRKSNDNDAIPGPQRSLSQTVIEIIDSVAAGNISGISGINDCDNVDDISSLKDEIKVLKSIVFKQEQSIVLLTSKMNQLLQVIGVEDTITDVDKNFVSPVDVDAQSLSDQPVVGPALNVTSNGTCNKNSTKERSTIARSFSQAVLKTVAIERKRQTIRKRNIVISGLPPSASRPDTTLAAQFLTEELQIEANIASCHRLGAEMENKVQLLKVSLKSEEQASMILRKAKRLRYSVDQFVRSNIFINKDLTKHELLQQYEARCRRREAVTHHKVSRQTANQTKDLQHDTNSPMISDESSSIVSLNHGSNTAPGLSSDTPQQQQQQS